MIGYEALNLLAPYVQHVRKVFVTQNIWIVGGAVRDILLGLTQQPTDIDITMGGEPDDIWKSADRSLGDRFRTEKFGTMTYISSQEDATVVQYECTPLRTEGGYTDRRHPDQIQWSSNIVLDSGRRDFTINSMYYTAVDFDNVPLELLNRKISSYIEEQSLCTKRSGWSVDFDQRVLVMTDHHLIDCFFSQSIIDKGQILAFLISLGGDESQIDVFRNILIDPNEGGKDLHAGVLRCVGSADRRFTEDALRLLRALRIVNVLNCRLELAHLAHDIDFDADTWKSIKKNYYLIQNIAKERIKDEILKAFSYQNPFGFVALLDESNMLKFVFPAVAATKGVNQPIRYHPLDTYHHTIMTLWNLQKINTSPGVKLGMLYHDVGKTEQYHTYSIGLTKDEMHAIQGSRLNHSVCGSEMAERDLKELSFPTKMIEEVSRYVRHHMEPGQILEAKNTKKIKKIRQRYSEFGADRVKNIFDICKADRLGQYNPIQSGGVEEVAILYDLLDQLISSEGQFTPKQMMINGHDLMEIFELQPGPLFQILLDKAFERVSDRIDQRNTKETIIVFLKGYIKQIQKV